MSTHAAAPRSFPFAKNGARIKSVRRRAGISQERLAAEVGTTRRHLIRLENGEHLPGRALRDRILAATRVDTSAGIESADDDAEDDRVPHRSLSEDLIRLARMAAVMELHPELIEVDT